VSFDGEMPKRLATRARPLQKARLLFLRVFGSSSQSQKLFDLLAARWRYAGNIHLKRWRRAPRSFRAASSLIFSACVLQGPTSAPAPISTGAGRTKRSARSGWALRVNEFFCRNDTWRGTVTRLMALSDLVVMDLRGFTSENEGCIFELRTVMTGTLVRSLTRRGAS
jgi:hypothetical protein